MINYYRFCCRIRIADEYADEVPGGEFLAVENGNAKDRKKQFADTRVNDISDWFYESPALLAHIRALQTGRPLEVRPRLVNTLDACVYTGRDRQTLYRWAREGRVTKHPLAFLTGRHRVGWDVLELEAVLKNLEKG